jgi:hypothetical protein
LNQRPPESAPDWQFPSLSERQRRQLITVERTTGVKSYMRACLETHTYFIVRIPPNLVDELVGLSKDERHFVLHNETPAERAKARKNGRRH